MPVSRSSSTTPLTNTPAPPSHHPAWRAVDRHWYEQDALRPAGYKQARYDEIANGMNSTLVNVDWKRDIVEKNTPVLSISGIYKIKGVDDVLAGRAE